MKPQTMVSTPDATSAEAQSRTLFRSDNFQNEPRGSVGQAGLSSLGKEGRHFTIGAGVVRANSSQPFQRRKSDPVYRPLRIFSIDPSLSRLEGAEATVNVPYEPLDPGPIGRFLEVDDRDDSRGQHWGKVDLEDRFLLMTDGRTPSVADPASHQQMVYAVASTVHAAFRRALGRQLNWAFDPRPSDSARSQENSAASSAVSGNRRVCRLVLRPHAREVENAWYDRERGEICFGYCHANEAAKGRVLPRGVVFTCLSHDVIAHEVTHAVLDGLRASFSVPTGPDVSAFHEGFADIVALFQHFAYPEVVRSAIARSKGQLEHAAFLTEIGAEFGRARGRGSALRSGLDELRDRGTGPKMYPAEESHENGEILVRAIFEAFLTVFGRKTERFRRLASGGTGLLPPGSLPGDLQDVLADRASKLAGQFLSICIRAIDYCPPVDIELGEYLRALVTADYELVPDDRWGYREALIDAFARRGIYPPAVATLAEDSLRWQGPPDWLPQIEDLHFRTLKFAGDPAEAANAEELTRQAQALGSLLAEQKLLDAFGLASRKDRLPMGDRVALPCIESIRTCRRVGPDGQVVFDLVAEITQRRRCRRGGVLFDFLGGATVIIDPRGELRYVISKNILNDERLERQGRYILGDGAKLWMRDGTQTVPRRNFFGLLCGPGQGSKAQNGSGCIQHATTQSGNRNDRD